MLPSSIHMMNFKFRTLFDMFQQRVHVNGNLLFVLDFSFNAPFIYDVCVCVREGQVATNGMMQRKG